MAVAKLRYQPMRTAATTPKGFALQRWKLGYEAEDESDQPATVKTR